MIPEAMHWVEQAQYDLETAKAMHEAGRYLYVLFCCQQAVEKTLKALIVNRTNEFPPRTHSLTRLADEAGLKPDPAQAPFLAELSAYYVQTRYPEEIATIGKSITSSMSDEVLSKTERAMEWLFSTLK